jgi:hypothetical protein
LVVGVIYVYLFEGRDFYGLWLRMLSGY